MKLPKIPIDYSKAGTGEVPFDGGGVLLHLNDCVLGYGAYEPFEQKRFIELYSLKPMQKRTTHRPTHYTPLPEFVEVQETIWDRSVTFPHLVKGGDK